MRALTKVFTACALSVAADITVAQAQVPADKLAAYLESGNADLKIRYDRTGAVALYLDPSWLFMVQDRPSDFNWYRDVSLLSYAGFANEDEVARGRKDSDGKWIPIREKNLYPCGPRHAMTADEIPMEAAAENPPRPKTAKAETMTLNIGGEKTEAYGYKLPKSGPTVWKREVRIFESASEGIRMLDETEAKGHVATLVRSPNDILLGCVDGVVFWCSKTVEPDKIFWRNAEPDAKIHERKIKGKIWLIFGIVKTKSGAIGVVGRRAKNIFDAWGPSMTVPHVLDLGKIVRD